MSAGKVLIVATSATKLTDGRQTGCWVEEVASPYLLWREKGLSVVVASVAGGAIPWDEASTSGDFFTPEADAFMKNAESAAAIQSTKIAEEILAGGIDSYDALFVPGGHGICFDGTSGVVIKLVEAFWNAGKVVSAVCHGPCALVTAQDAAGNSILKGRACTGFTDAEERAVGKDQAVPFLLEQRMRELGGAFVAGPDWHPHAVSDGKLITGQNPASSKRVAELVVEAPAPARPPCARLARPPTCRVKHQEEHHHHDHHDQHPRQGARHDEVDPTKARSSWHQTYRPPI
ncbi:glutamine amidotransferase [Micractinium conductrix]|uniref:Glutamine amidotransferase n=1 Tax=Micractinium conductrix TaxID=554055 RepID=A0A2P6V3M6_9CHLO|nr:glutamine amidotransferase [Micractinium conductrix]|eukprot:PSC68692.1 glutamine amidotransferase [Micractinium conductrix]